MKRALIYIVVRALFAAALYFGLVEGIEGAARVALFWAWFTFAGGLLCMFSKPDTPRPRLLPYWVVGWIEFALVLLMVWHGWSFTAVAYGMGTLMLVVKSDGERKAA